MQIFQKLSDDGQEVIPVTANYDKSSNPARVLQRAGHASIEETMDTYGHLFPNAKHQLSSMLDSYANRHKTIAPLEIAN